MKKYIAPTSNVVMLRTATQILINSIYNQEASENTVGMSREQRRSSSWDDEDE